jgi:hypothetical protein
MKSIMLHKLFPFTIIVLFFFALSSCKSPCDDFPDMDLKWVPYEIGDTLKYTDGVGIIEFKVADIYKTEHSKKREFYLAMDIECDARAYFETNTNYLVKYKLKVTDHADYAYIDVEIEPNKPINFSYDTNFPSKGNVVAKYYSEKEIDDKIYHDLFIVDIDTAKNLGSISEFILVANAGLLEFHDAVKNKTWKLIK